MNFPRKLAVGVVLTMLMAMLTSTGVFAQVGFPVKMKLSDKSTDEPVGFATVSMTLKGAQEPLKYVMSTEAGEVDFEGIVRGTYILKAELMGYKPYQKEIVVDRLIDLGTVQMEPDVEVLGVTPVIWSERLSLTQSMNSPDWSTVLVRSKLMMLTLTLLTPCFS